MTVRWITPSLGTAPADAIEGVFDAKVLDVRDMVDGPGNSERSVREKIEEGCKYIKDGYRTVVCCDHGISRSSAIAAGILATLESVPLDEAVLMIVARNPSADIHADVLRVVRSVLGEVQEAPTANVGVVGGGQIGDLVRRTRPLGETCIVIPHSAADLLSGSAELARHLRLHGIGTLLLTVQPRATNTNRAIGEAVAVTGNALEAARAADCRLVLLSRWEVFAGYFGDRLVADESFPVRPRGYIGDAKYVCERLCEIRREQSGTQYAVARCAFPVGAGLAPRFIRRFLSSALETCSIQTHRFSSGPPELDLVDAGDLARALWLSLIHI